MTDQQEPDSKPKTNKLMDEAAEAGPLDLERSVLPEAAPEPDRQPKEPVKGVYVLEPGDTPGIVSQKIYGRGHMAVPLARANMNSDWQAGSTINLL